MDAVTEFEGCDAESSGGSAACRAKVEGDRVSAGDSQSGRVALIQELCDRFLKEWQQGASPEIGPFLQDVPPEWRGAALSALINADLSERRLRGESPRPSEYLEKFPGDRPTICAAFDVLTSTLTDGSLSESHRQPLCADRFQIGSRIGKFELINILGRGGTGVVFAAFDELIRREVAIKLMTPRDGQSATATLRLLQEARTAGSLQHPNIVSIYDVVEFDGGIYVVMEKVQGSTLAELLMQSADHRLPWRDATQIIMECCDALDAAHQRSLIHRDIKPQNIMRTPSGHIKLLDFGLAKGSLLENTAQTEAGTILGTPDFMSPEQFRSDPLDQRTDLYSLGATYFCLLTGHPPFADAGNHLKVMYAHCHQPLPRVRDLVDDVPFECDAVLARAMAKDPAQRFQSSSELKRTLALLLDEGRLDAATIISPAIANAPSKNGVREWCRGRIAGFLGIAAVLIALAGWFFGTSRDAQRETRAPAVADTESASPVPEMPLESGVFDDRILFGTTTSYSGPSRELGRNMALGIKTCFAGVNAAGGIHGRQLELLVLDDGYVPEVALQNMQELLGQRQVFAIIGNVGTPTARVTMPYAVERSRLFFAPFSGARLLRNDPPDRYVFNYRASYADETAAMVHYFVEVLRISPRKIAVFAQNDAYGDDGFFGVVKAMRMYQVREEEILRVGYDRNMLDVEAGATKILAAGDQVEAVVMVPTYKAAAKFVSIVRAQLPLMKFAAVSFVGSEALAEEFRENQLSDGVGLLVTQVVPHDHSNATGVLRYRQLLQKYFPEDHPGSVSLEGFIAAECLVEGLRRAGRELTTERLVDALESIHDLDLGIGPIINFGPSRHQASHQVWGTRLNATGEFEAVDLD